MAEPVLGDPPNVSRLVDALVDRGDVRRSQDPADRRSWHVSLTPLGAKRLDAMYDAVVRERDRVFAGLEPTEVESLSRALDRVDENLREILAST